VEVVAGVDLGGTAVNYTIISKEENFLIEGLCEHPARSKEGPQVCLAQIEEGLKKVIEMDWETLIPGHPGPGGKQTGTKDNAREQLAYLQDLSSAVKKAVNDSKSYADAQKDIKLPKYEAWPNYNAFLPMNIERYFDFWNRGI